MNLSPKKKLKDRNVITLKSEESSVLLTLFNIISLKFMEPEMHLSLRKIVNQKEKIFLLVRGKATFNYAHVKKKKYKNVMHYEITMYSCHVLLCSNSVFEWR